MMNKSQQNISEIQKFQTPLFKAIRNYEKFHEEQRLNDAKQIKQAHSDFFEWLTIKQVSVFWNFISKRYFDCEWAPVNVGVNENFFSKDRFKSAMIDFCNEYGNF